MKRVEHTFEAFYNEDSELLILGSMPSVKSRIICIRRIDFGKY